MVASKTPTIAITGATGFLGTVLVNFFLNKGWRVISLARNPGNITNKNLEFRHYDLANQLPPKTFAGVDFIIHAAYVKQAYNVNALDINVIGAENLITAIKKSAVKQTIFISSMSAHDDAISVYGRQKLAIEALFSNLKNSTVVRPGLIIGDGGIVKEMSNIMKSKHVVPLVDGGNQPLQIVGVDDLAIALHQILSKSLFGHFVVATTKVYKYKDFYKSLAKYLKTPVAYVPIPYKMLEYIFKIVDLLPIKLGVGDDNLKGLKKLTSMDSAADLKKIGITVHDLDEALEASKITHRA